MQDHDLGFVPTSQGAGVVLLNLLHIRLELLVIGRGRELIRETLLEMTVQDDAGLLHSRAEVAHAIVAGSFFEDLAELVEHALGVRVRA